MPYVGKAPVGGGFHKLDALTASATATYSLTLGGASYFPETANQLLVSLNGIIQAPQDSFQVSGSNLIFDSALTSNDSIDFVVALGDVLGVQGVTDGTVTTAKLGNGAVTDAKIANGAVTKAKIGTTELNLATIKDSTGTNTAMTIDSSGHYVANTRWIAIHKDGNQSVSAAASTGLNTWAVTGSNGLTWNNTNHRLDITAATAGIYYINFQLSVFSNSNNIGDVRARVRKNGAVEFGAYNLVVQGGTSANPFDLRHATYNSSGIVTVANGDNIDFNCIIDGGSPTIYAGDGQGQRATHAFIQQIG